MGAKTKTTQNYHVLSDVGLSKQLLQHMPYNTENWHALSYEQYF